MLSLAAMLIVAGVVVPPLVLDPLTADVEYEPPDSVKVVLVPLGTLLPHTLVRVSLLGPTQKVMSLYASVTVPGSVPGLFFR